MKFFKLPLTVLFIFAFNLSNAAEVQKNKITFNKPEKFTDFSRHISRSDNDRAFLVKKLTQSMNQSLNAHSKNTFEIVVEDIDMAGRFVLSNNNDYIRVVNEFDRTRFEFTYKMFDPAGKVIKESAVNLTDRQPHSLKKRSKKYKNTLFINEMILFDDWLKAL